MKWVYWVAFLTVLIPTAAAEEPAAEPGAGEQPADEGPNEAEMGTPNSTDGESTEPDSSPPPEQGPEEPGPWEECDYREDDCNATCPAVAEDRGTSTGYTANTQGREVGVTLPTGGVVGYDAYTGTYACWIDPL